MPPVAAALAPIAGVIGHGAAVAGGAALKAAPMVGKAIGGAGKLGFQGIKGLGGMAKTGLSKLGGGLTPGEGLGTTGIGPFKDATTYGKALNTGISPNNPSPLSMLKNASGNINNFLQNPLIQQATSNNETQQQPTITPPSVNPIQIQPSPLANVDTNINPWGNLGLSYNKPLSSNNDNNPWSNFNRRF